MRNSNVSFKSDNFCFSESIYVSLNSSQMESILNSTAQPVVGEERVAALTAWERQKWANVRETVFNKGTNRVALQTVESAAFVLSLDDEPFEFDVNAPSKLDKFGTVLLHGKGCDRWFDKSFTVCVGTNGRVRKSCIC